MSRLDLRRPFTYRVTATWVAPSLAANSVWRSSCWRRWSVSLIPNHMPFRHIVGKFYHTILSLDAGARAKYHFGMSALKQFRERARLTQQELADAASTSQPQIRRLEAGERKLTKEWAERLAPALGIRAETLLFPPANLNDPKVQDGPGWTVDEEGGLDVPGEVAAGRFLTVDTAVDETVYERAPVVPDARYPRMAQYGLVVRGTSINQIAIDGDILHCVDIGISGHQPQNGELVIVEQMQFGGHLRERTAKVYRVAEGGSVELHPDSDDPRWREPIYVPRRELEWKPREDLQVSVRAFVIGTYRPLQKGPRR
jgi:transcriptional regulator with XRE-family HTH domain